MLSLVTTLENTDSFGGSVRFDVKDIVTFDLGESRRCNTIFQELECYLNIFHFFDCDISPESVPSSAINGQGFSH